MTHLHARLLIASTGLLLALPSSALAQPPVAPPATPSEAVEQAVQRARAQDAARRDAIDEAASSAASPAAKLPAERTMTPPKSPATPGGYGLMLLKLTLAVLLVCAAAFLSLKYGVRRLVGGAEDDSPMRVISRLPLEPRRSLIVTQVASKTLVLATSEAGVQLITELDAADAAALLGTHEDAPAQRPFDLDADGDPDAEAPVQLD
jgi:flagellar biogenesis protein FliO